MQSREILFKSLNSQLEGYTKRMTSGPERTPETQACEASYGSSYGSMAWRQHPEERAEELREKGQTARYGGLLLSGSKDKWRPWSHRFWHYHLGTDFQVANWLFAISAAFWLAMSLDTTRNLGNDIRTDVKVGAYCQIFSSLLFTLGTFAMIEGSYHEQCKTGEDKPKLSALTGLSWTQRHFTGNAMLLGAWCYTLCFVPFFVLGIVAVTIYEGQKYTRYALL